MTDYTMESCREFVSVLASSRPAPGGGGAAALVGAIGTALANMVGSLTVGKKKYADVEAELTVLIEECHGLEAALLNCVPADEEGFAPLAAAYSIPKDAPGRDDIMEKARLDACAVPMQIMELCCRAVKVTEIFAQKGSQLAVSDAGCAAVCLKAALEAASLNVYVNTKTVRDRRAAEIMNARCGEMLAVYGAVCDSVYASVRMGLLS